MPSEALTSGSRTRAQEKFFMCILCAAHLAVGRITCISPVAPAEDFEAVTKRLSWRTVPSTHDSSRSRERACSASTSR